MAFYYDQYPVSGSSDVYIARIGENGTGPSVDAGFGDDFILTGLDLFFPTNGTNFLGTTKTSAYSLDNANDQWTVFENLTVYDDSVPHLTIVHTPAANGGAAWWSITLEQGEILTVDIDTWGLNPTLAQLVIEHESGGLSWSASGSNITDGGEGSRFAQDPFLQIEAPSDGVYYVKLESIADHPYSGEEAFVVNFSATYQTPGATTYHLPPEKLEGGYGTDLIIGGDGTQVIYGANTGTDGLPNGISMIDSAPDRLVGGPGDDYYYVDALDVVVEHPGEGVDTINFATEDYDGRLHPNIENFIAVELIGLITRTIWGNANENSLLGAAYAQNTLYGGPGDDRLSGRFLRDFLHGESGKDELRGCLENRRRDSVLA